ncbi:carbohydrate-binding domain-containing protein [Bacillus sp. B1-b2]|uniref:carbohydrate-binding domain-containing protein n=1 Tax=Bacillus sp. B1-b2 TaxID=2653201 RepID=UPI001262A987|nr:carbohydrate-binding domain-containing protein [Bacillus sp. B1-b2]KAB7670712.1 carbohydrate-binding domain-containing protein [Bacillus sp. B1-b2]
MNFSKYKKLALPICCTLFLFACSKEDTSDSTTSNTSTLKDINVSAYISENISYEEEDLTTEWENEDPIYITLDGENITYDESASIMTSGSTVTIRSGGVYVLSGEINDGQVVVDAPDTGTVKLVLNGVDITNSESSAIFIKEAENTIITLADGTENSVEDGQTYTEDDGSGEPNAPIFSKDDLTINGTGTLSVTGNYDNGIVSKDDLRIINGNIKVTAVDDGILGRDLVAIKDGAFDLEVGGDGIKSTNTNEEKGIVAIESGTFTITSGTDGIQAESSLYIANGTFNINAGGGSPETVQVQEGMMGGQPWGDNEEVETEEDTLSTRGLKANLDIAIGGGTYDLDALGDGMKSDGNIMIMSGDITVATGDDGLDAVNNVYISGGSVDVTKSYEGLEAAAITINDGNISLATSDDGINASEGTSGKETGGGMGMESAGNALLTINGGTILVNAGGDGLDSNGSIVVTGGTTIVNGPTNDGNGSLDYDGTLNISGGTLIAAGSSGMAQATSDTSTQNAILMTYSEAQIGGTIIHIEDSEGNTVATFTPTKDYQSVLISSPSISKDTMYSIYSGGSVLEVESNGLSDGTYAKGEKVVEFTISNSVTYVDESGVTEAPTNQMAPGGGGTPPSGGFGRDRGQNGNSSNNTSQNN